MPPYTKIVAATEPTAARVRLSVTGGPTGEALYVFRRDSEGVAVVRDTSEGTVVWPTQGELITSNLIPEPGLLFEPDDATADSISWTTDTRVERDTAHALVGGLGWSLRAELIDPFTSNTYPSSTTYPSTNSYPQTGA